MPARRVPLAMVVVLMALPALAPVGDATHTGVGYWWRYVTEDAAVAIDITAGANGFGSFRIEAESASRDYALGFFLVDRDTGTIRGRTQVSDDRGIPDRDCVLGFGHNLILEVDFPHAGNYTLVAFGMGGATCEVYFRYHDLHDTTWTAWRTSFNTAYGDLADFAWTEHGSAAGTGHYSWSAPVSRKTLTATGHVFAGFDAEWPGTCPGGPSGILAVEGPAPMSGSDEYVIIDGPPGAYAFTLDGSFSWAPEPLGGAPACRMGTAAPKIQLFAADVVYP